MGLRKDQYNFPKFKGANYILPVYNSYHVFMLTTAAKFNNTTTKWMDEHDFVEYATNLQAILYTHIAV